MEIKSPFLACSFKYFLSIPDQSYQSNDKLNLFGFVSNYNLEIKAKFHKEKVLLSKI